MKISHFDIQNFRKLKNCRVELADETTIFVGANNSGKTSAMDALIMFLKKTKRREITTTDITLSNWTEINKIGTNWASEKEQPDLTLNAWRENLPSIDVWLNVDESQIHHVSHILPSLRWDNDLIGVRLILEPKDREKLRKSFLSAYSAAIDTIEARNTTKQKSSTSSFKLWPYNMRDFLDREFQEFFSIHAYVLDPSLAKDTQPQPFTEYMEALDNYPFDGLFKIDIINAQRGFSDSNAGEGISNTDRRLSAQLRNYFDKHLDPNELPDLNDLDALEAIEDARTIFDEQLQDSFKGALEELEILNYPGFSNPELLLSSKVNPLEGLNHPSAVQFKVFSSKDPADSFCLPEKYNGLGYQNLISMIFNLIRFRDEWMRVGKASKREALKNKHIEPLHLMLIEEPEAHLHAQVQQVFVKKAFNVLRNHPELQSKKFATQMVISTHSSHIAHEANFTGLRYFRRQLQERTPEIPSAYVVNLSSTFKENSKKAKDTTEQTEQNKKEIATARFATRYLKTTHCDLFFADAAILVEGPAERMLVPHFIKHHYPNLDRSYISLLEIGGSHAHRLKPLIEKLGLPTLVLTDLDSIPEDSRSKVLPALGENQRTGNDTLKTWAPIKNRLDEVLSATSDNKIVSEGNVRVAYPCATEVKFDTGEDGEIAGSPIPYTFEDALVLANLSAFRKMTDTKGLINKMVEATQKPTLDEACQAMFEALDKNSKKAEMALELLYSVDPSILKPPEYITEGLDWLKTKIVNIDSLPEAEQVIEE